ncbi:MmgE/PrpD family protein [Pigmentiphaga sp. H8]|uniref:MmgE/PrpD family protein n=1 Tax=Pigmentiphaga sp. H8 TaxID=2488560 RepID=UPI000F5B05E9|nr:MmgE/PrpD family protein [Pigmentiphaga sp. H8]AZG08267.1 MmgE/PrpD family protein [Pigmentiphaga sp. H8]
MALPNPIDASAARGNANRLLEFLHGVGQMPESAPTDLARWCLLDALGCGLLGSRQPWGSIVQDDVLEGSGPGSSSILGRRQRVGASQAALCNGTAMHGFELDDLLAAALIHPGAVIVPAALAAAEAADADGLALLRGIVAGYEATERISLALGTDPSSRGFHKTSVVGPVAGAVAAGVCMGLDFRKLQWAVGLACSCASGIKNFAVGGGAGMVKRLHAGRAAEAAVRAVMLADRGFTAPLGAIDGKFGLLEAFGGASARPELLDAQLGGRWALDDVWVKVYPICGWIQGVVQLLLEMRAEHSLDPVEIGKVTVATSSFAVKYNGSTEIVDTMDAQYSIPYCAAVALTGDPLDPGEYGDERIQDSRRRALASKVKLTVDGHADAVYPKRFACHVTVSMKDGSRFEARTQDAHGTPGDPCTGAERVVKFSRLCELAGLGLDAASVAEGVRCLSSGSSVRVLMNLLQPAR